MKSYRLLSAVYALSVAIIIWPAIVRAAIDYGGYTFNDLAFSDNATQLEPGYVHWLTGGDFNPDDAIVDDALTEFSPSTGLGNIGFTDDTIGTAANLFQLDFTDLHAINNSGADIILFEAFDPDPYAIAVNIVGSGLSNFISFSQESMILISEVGPIGTTSTYALEIDLDAFGLQAGTIVDAIQFSALQNNIGNVEGDPYMAAVLNAVPIPSALWLFGSGLLGLVGMVRRKKVNL